jgi:translation initiation factor IF-2
MSRTIQIEDTITVGTLAEKLEIPVTRLIGELMKNGILATVNERIDYDTAHIILEEMDLDVVLERKTSDADAQPQRRKASDKGDTRPPVIAVMGHVDHGKTSLLDAVIGSKVASGESGGITQHISAYQVDHGGKKVTFLDTPGHEAFAAIREHGAHLTDIALIVVAADDGVKPQTVEAIRFAKKAGVKMVVAINKIDKTGADPNRVKQELSEQGLMAEEWGGDVVMVEVSAQTKQGLDKLLDMIMLVAEVEDLKAEADGPGEGLIIEAHMEQGRGAVGVALVDSGVICPGDFIVAGSTYAKIRTLELNNGGKLESAGPSTPVVITGFKALPRFGDTFTTVKSEKEARTKAEETAKNQSQADSSLGINSADLIRIIDRQKQVQDLNVIVKADVQGSLKSVIDSLRSLETDEVKVRLVGSGVGSITEKDVHLASTSGSIIYGFNINASSNIKHSASKDKVSVRLFDVIYELIDDAKQELEDLLPDEIVRTDTGRLLVKGVFKITKNNIICGGEVTKGKLTIPSLVTVFRGDEAVADRLEVAKLQQGPQEVKEVPSGEMCGASFNTPSRVEVKEGDRIEFYTEKVVARKL